MERHRAGDDPPGDDQPEDETWETARDDAPPESEQHATPLRPAGSDLHPADAPDGLRPEAVEPEPAGRSREGRDEDGDRPPGSGSSRAGSPPHPGSG
ncbi:hypothetical protein ACVGVM_13135 [Pseudonocardia bannensis]